MKPITVALSERFHAFQYHDYYTKQNGAQQNDVEHAPHRRICLENDGVQPAAQLVAPGLKTGFVGHYFGI
jgi:hypothetical protein